MRYLLTKALIIKKQPSGENDWYLTLFSPELGKIGALSRSSRKIGSRKGAHLDPLNLCTFQLYGKNGHYWITECKTEKAFLEIKNDLERSLLAFTILELLQRTIQAEEENGRLFGLTIHALEQLSAEHNELFLEEFKIKLLKTAGSWPDLTICSACERKLDSGDTILTDNEGRLFCPVCQQLHPAASREIDFRTIRLANFLSLEQPLPSGLKISRENLFHLKKMTALFLGRYLHQELLSEKILQN
jgi:DNA repair protein RecO (recombination protein O)